jgi:hypothetical protein
LSSFICSVTSWSLFLTSSSSSDHSFRNTWTQGSRAKVRWVAVGMYSDVALVDKHG